MQLDLNAVKDVLQVLVILGGFLWTVAKITAMISKIADMVRDHEERIADLEDRRPPRRSRQRK